MQRIKVSVRSVAATVSRVLVGGVLAFSATIYFADPDLAAPTREVPGAPGAPGTTKPSAPNPRPAPQQTTQSTPLPAAAGTVRTETITYDSWTVNCRDTADGKTKAVCAATLPMTVRQQNQLINLGAWIIGHNNEGAFVLVVQAPLINNVGVLIAKGLQLRLGEGKPRMASYLDCVPQHCEAALPMDEATMKEMTAAANGPAAITFWKVDGTELTINIPSIKGVDKAIAAVR